MKMHLPLPLPLALLLLAGALLPAQAPGGTADRPQVHTECVAPPCTPPPPLPPKTTPRQVWLDPIYVTVVDAEGFTHRVLVQEGLYKTIEIPVFTPPQPPPPPPSTRHFPLLNRQRFQVQIEEAIITRTDGTAVLVILPADRVIASGSTLPFELPHDAVSMSIRFREWDFGNKRFRLPLIGFATDLRQSPAATIL